MTGIYCIVNRLNNYRYIGATVDIYGRWKTHKRNAQNPQCKEYNKPLYQAMRKDGMQHFDLEIIEECDVDILPEREQYWIAFYNSMTHGYNQTPGGTGVKESNKQEGHPKHKVSLDDVIAIRTAYKQHERKRDVYQQYRNKINKTGFHKIWNGVTWPDIMPEIYTTENAKFHANNTSNPGTHNGRSKLTEDDVRTIRLRRKNGETLNAVYQDFAQKTTYGSFKNVWFGYNWKTIIV
jgi:group I intron endonuclease